MASPAQAGAAAVASAPELDFAVEDGYALRHTMAPTLGLAVRVASGDGRPVRSLALNVQLRIAATRRAYAPAEQERLVEVFGAPEAWGRNLGSLLWATTTVNVPPFAGETVFELAVPCTYDFEVASAKYLHALEGGEVPLELLFSGTVFYAGSGGGLQVASLPWDREAQHRLPVSVWRETMAQHFGDSAWLRLRRDHFDRLYAYRTRHAMLSWEDVLADVLDRAEREEA
jgi:Family of unknown function (DUF6084)